MAWFILGWALDIGLILDELLNSKKDLFDGDARFPVLFLVEDAETHVSRRVDVRVGQQRVKFALNLENEATFRRSDRVVVGEFQPHCVGACLPDGLELL